MINLSIRIKKNNLIDLADSTHNAIGQAIHYLDYTDFYNLQSLIKKFRFAGYQEYINPLTANQYKKIKINLNEAISYIKLIKLDTDIYTHHYISTIHRLLTNDIDKQLMDLKKLTIYTMPKF